MLSVSFSEPWPEGCVGLEEEVVTAASQSEERDKNDDVNNVNNNKVNKNTCNVNNNNTTTTTTNSSFNLSLDDSLTSLQWLQEFSIQGSNVPPPPPPLHHFQNSHYNNSSSNLHHHHHHHYQQRTNQLSGSEAPPSPLAGDPASFTTSPCGSPMTPGKPTASASSSSGMLLNPGAIVAHGHCPSEVDYKTNAHIKPPYSYATLICMAMQASKKTKITLSAIYKWITDNFCYYRHADPTWQNSIRHNLSLNKCFIKVPREKDEPGKGGFWRIDPVYAERLLTGAYKKRRLPPVRINPALHNRIRASHSNQGNQIQDGRPPSASGNGTGVFECVTVDAQAQQLLREFEEATGADQNWDPHLAEGTMLGSWPIIRGSSKTSLKRKLGTSRHNNKNNNNNNNNFNFSTTKSLHHHHHHHLLHRQRSSSPLLSMDDQREGALGGSICPLKGDFDWDALLDSALNGDLSLDDEPLSPLMAPGNCQDLTVRGTHISPPIHAPNTPNVIVETLPRLSGNLSGTLASEFDEETFLATAFLETPWPGEEEEIRGGGRGGVGGGVGACIEVVVEEEGGGEGGEEEVKSDFLCSSTVNLDQLFDLGDTRIDVML